MRQRLGGLYSLASGALLVLGFAPLGWWPLSLLLLGAWLACWASARPGQALRQGFWLGLGLYLAGVSWVFVSVHVYGGAPAWMAVILVLALAAYLASFLALAIGAAWWLCPPGALRWLLALPACWVFAEHARGSILDGFPWLGLGYLLQPAPGASALLPLGGVALLGVAVWWLAAAVPLLRARRPVPALAPAALLMAAAGVLPAASHYTQARGAPLPAALVQGNMPQDQKWLPENLLPTVELYDALTAPLTQPLVIWPEVAIPASRFRVEGWFRRWQEQSAARGQTLLAGIITRQQERPYNTVYALGPRPGRYVKQQLVPFGEYFPVPDWMRPVVDWLELPISDIRTDMAADRYLWAGDTPLALSICFESVFPHKFARQAQGSGLLVNVTNDAWFAGTLAPQQHLQIARTRAAETGRPLLRVANTGISAAIDANGGLEATLPWGQRGVLETTVQPRQGQTPYMRWLDAPLTWWAGSMLLLLLARRVVSIPAIRARAPDES